MKAGLVLFAIAAARAAGPQPVPVVAELFTSEGCSSCPPADRLLAELDRSQPVAGARVIVLSEHVDYWNQLGWRDPFSEPQFSRRQEQYARVLGGDVYTPELVVDGRDPVLGNDAAAVGKAILRAAARAKAPVRIAGARREGAEAAIEIAIPPLTKGRGEVWVAIADESARSSVSRGENAGRTLVHVAVVRSLTKAGKVDKSEGMERTLRMAVGQAPARAIVFVADSGGTIFGADEAAVR
ncbi:MAG TPA: DUF1223 domain-containing protein [Bryobacteraceae bacterium]|jgi:hypothetical protein|nr:DUF1223 domain-containing protein [Bryobacteraceae bacterium]